MITNSSPDMPQRGIEISQIEFFRVEFAADPVEIFVMLFVVGVTNRR
jgi:hypothetical protein